MFVPCKDVEEALALRAAGLLWCNVDFDLKRRRPRWILCDVSPGMIAEGFKYGVSDKVGHWISTDFAYYVEE